MRKCGECVHFEECKPFTTENESFPEVKGGCVCFKSKPVTELIEQAFKRLWDVVDRKKANK